MIFSYLLNMQSHPSWVCGLKHTPLTQKKEHQQVTPFVGVWIETSNEQKPTIRKRSHTLRGCVD